MPRSSKTPLSINIINDTQTDLLKDINKFTLLFWFFLLGAASVYASTCTASPQGNLDRRFDQSFARQAQRECRSAGGSPKGNNNRPACDFRGDPPRNFNNRRFQVTVSDNGRNRNVNARWSCRR
ncbi:unnamed protein product [Colletotrichum noveboracense]|uniref:Uncharacterized protein n=1 Tax=Colletotrichum noveboracense TaxID=2664923 RepID=A0A9W4WIR3_9PEZI|nr:unnamed protein product [Colletotrichum noveboracense]